MLDRMRDAARRARRETEGARRLGEAVPGARLTWRGDRATVVLPEGAATRARAAAEDALRRAGASDVLVVESGPAGPVAPPRDAPQQASSGGHADPLRLGRTDGPAPVGKSRPRGVRRTVAVASGKGGVGKSTIAARLALALAARGERVGLLDLDIYGPSVPLMFGVTGAPDAEGGTIRPALAAIRTQGTEQVLPLLSIGLLVDDAQALAWRGPMVMGAVRQLTEQSDWHEDGAPLDWLVIDTPPGTGDAHLSMGQRVTLDAAVLVTTPSPLALADLRRGAQLFARLGVPILGVVENMAGGAFGDALPDEALASLGTRRLARLPIHADLARLPASGGDLASERLAPVVDALLALDPQGPTR